MGNLPTLFSECYSPQNLRLISPYHSYYLSILQDNAYLKTPKAFPITPLTAGFTTTYQYDDNNRLTQEDDVIYRYDDNGNLKEKNSAEEDVLYFYDHENHLTRVETTRFGATIVVEYEYDADGNRPSTSLRTGFIRCLMARL